ncbi:olfactory receptor 13-like [Spea bombifrons]|uniref:olfactory receptor 13-like n=1 Tax=Spea bombifrons TaxID=233779 RepID=UPI00234BC29E|nr:olfactory receptor 13-like [Spea bombifrons]
MRMQYLNQTSVTEFILIGLSQEPRTRVLLSVLFLIIYLVTIFGNLILICTVIVTPRMHTPMYYFLCNLSFLDLFYSSCTIPKMLCDMIFSVRGRISLIGCMMQMSTSLFLGETECILLAVMAYDRYVAICFPLRYMVIMSWRMCKNITIIVWLGSFLSTHIPTIIKPLTFCGGNKVNNFVCESISLLKLVCGDTSFHETMILCGSLLTSLAPFAFILVSYACVITSILKMQPTDGKTKAFSTCASHLTVVLMFYGTSMSVYLGPTKNVSGKQKYVTVIYSVVTPMLNPLIYSLRNNDVKVALRNILRKNKEHT